MKVLVLGGAGYIGSVLCPYLKSKGYDVSIYDVKQNKEEDIRNLNKLIPALHKADAIIHLAGLPNDITSDKDPEITWNVNYTATDVIAKLSRGKKIIYASSCSVYGFGKEEFYEDSILNPQTLYGRTKKLSEELFTDAVILRFATVYGYSPATRLDLVVNKMIFEALNSNEIIVNGGDQWRPIVHVKDVARAIEKGLSMERWIYNVGSNSQNYQIKDIAEIIAKETGATIVPNNTIDFRSYKVNFDRFGLKTQYNVQDAIKEFKHEGF